MSEKLWRVVGCIKFCDNGRRGMDNCTVCGCTGYQLLVVADRKRYANTKDGWDAMREEHPEISDEPKDEP